MTCFPGGISSRGIVRWRFIPWNFIWGVLSGVFFQAAFYPDIRTNSYEIYEKCTYPRNSETLALHIHGVAIRTVSFLTWLQLEAAAND